MSEPQLKTQWLEHYVLVCQAGGFRAAAEQLGLSRQTLQRSVEQLEAQVQAPLLQREGKQFQLTQAGQLLLQQARELTQALQSLSLRIMQVSEALSGSISFAWQSATCLDFLPAALSDFIGSHPEVFLNIQNELQTSALAERLAQGRLDLAVMDITPQTVTDAGEGFVIEAGRRSPFVIVSAPQPPCHWSALNYAIPAGPSPQQRKARWDDQAYPRQIVCSSDSMDVLLDWALTGRAAVYLPHMTVQGLIEQGKLAIVAQPPEPAYKELYLCSTPAALARPAVKALHQALSRVMKS